MNLVSQNHVATLILLAACVLLPGCSRNPSNGGGKLSQAGPATPSVAQKEIAGANKGTPDASAMVQITGGKFIMGDKNEVDAPPHEVVVSSLLIDKHLETGEQFEKITG